MKYEYKAYAKINPGLDIVGVRDNGYHEVRIIMQTIGLFDRLTFEKSDNGNIEISANIDWLDLGPSNLIYKACEVMREKFNITEGVSVYLEKNIPVAAGMAGGSTDCAAALIAMNDMFDLGLTKEELMEIGTPLGADVPYCVKGGTALCEGIGEVFTELKPIPDCFILIAKPDIDVSTRDVYVAFDSIKVEKHPDIDGIIGSINQGDLKGVTDKMGNVLELVTSKMHPVVTSIEEAMMESGAIAAMMSGSGPTVFGVFDDEETAKKAGNRLVDLKYVTKTYVVKPYNP